MSASTTDDVIAEIRAEMARRSVTQTDLAPQVGLSVPALRRRMSGESHLLVDELLAIAGVLQVSPATFVDPPRKASPGRVTDRGSDRIPPQPERTQS